MSDESYGRLVSWKEIAAYLGCDVRTCLRWEKERGLPVHRPGGTPGPRVMAWKKELDDWLNGTAHQEPPPAASPAPDTRAGHQVGSGRMTLIRLAILALATGAAAWLAIGTLTRDREPRDFRIEGSKLIILNASQKRLAEFDTGLDGLWPEASYRKRFQTKHFSEKDDLRNHTMLAIKDLDRDGRAEILFVPRASSGSNAKRLYCFDERGAKRWTFDGGRAMVFGSQALSGDYFSSFETLDLDGDGRLEIVVLSDNNTRYPTQLAILSADGRLRAEYWHSGRICDLIPLDHDGDGRPELLIGGVNNEYRKAFLALLDPRNLSGSSPNSAAYNSPALSAGTERAYLLLPWTDIDPVNDRHVVLSLIDLLDNGRVRVQTSQSHVLYELDSRSLACLDVSLSNIFEVLHRQAVDAGKVLGPLDEAYRENLRRGLLYWTGRGWTSTPTMASRRP